MTKAQGLTAKTLYDRIRTRRQNAVSTMKECELLVQCRDTGDFNPMKTSNLYNRASGEYCEMLEILEILKIK